MRTAAALLLGIVILNGCEAASQPFLVLSGPKDLVRLEVRDTRAELIWSIEATTPRTLESIYYGVVPQEFVQVVPEPSSLPRDLVDREVLVVTTTTLRREFTHYGFARGSGGFQVNHSEMKNRVEEP